MIAFPICERLQVDNYGLYPGVNKNHRLDINFKAGLTLILGANGLGKTTLISLLFRLLTGPADLRESGGDSLGTVSLKAAELNQERRREFAQRVHDGAASASAALTYTLGIKRIVVTRSLRNLQLLSLEADGVQIKHADEQTYIRLVCESTGVHAFGDFLLLLRQLVFYFEDRRSLVWDSSAQTELLRALVLPPDEASKWSELRGSALSLDSYLRNTQAIMNRKQRTTGNATLRQRNASEVRVEIDATEKLQRADTDRQEFLGTRAGELDILLSRYRLDLLRAERSADSASRNVERAQLSAIERAFPSVDDSMRYIFAQLVSDGLCRACGQPSKVAVERMQRNLAENRCAICDLPLPSGSLISAGELTNKRIHNAREEASKAWTHFQAAQRTHDETLTEYTQVQSDLAEISARIGQRSQKLQALINQLPPEEAKLRESQIGLHSLKSQVETLRAELAEAQKVFSEFVEERIRRMHDIAEQVKKAFSEYAEGFLMEQVRLSWSPTPRRLGVYSKNPLIDFPAFVVDISGSDFPEPVRRDGPEQVSESQREFIDLAFRMALIKVTATGHAGTLVIDAPESSLDAVFVKRAATVLGRFALANNQNHLIITSNILPGDLLPELIHAATAHDRSPEVVDLFQEGVPTAAVRSLESEYAEYRKQLDQRVDALRNPRPLNS